MIRRLRSVSAAALAVIVVSIAAPAVAQIPAQPAGTPAQRTAVGGLDFMDGEWRGEAVVTGPGGRMVLTQTERIGSLLFGACFPCGPPQAGRHLPSEARDVTGSCREGWWPETHVTDLQAIFVPRHGVAAQRTCASLDHLPSAFNPAERRLEPRPAHISASCCGAVFPESRSEGRGSETGWRRCRRHPCS